MKHFKNSIFALLLMCFSAALIAGSADMPGGPGYLQAADLAVSFDVASNNLVGRVGVQAIGDADASIAGGSPLVKTVFKYSGSSAAEKSYSGLPHPVADADIKHDMLTKQHGAHHNKQLTGYNPQRKHAALCKQRCSGVGLGLGKVPRATGDGLSFT